MLKLFLLLALPLTYVLAQTVDSEPWEPGEGTINLLQKEERIQRVTSFFDYCILATISYYQHSISSKSVSRCPFEISCSRFATIAIERYSLFGYAIFIDRYFYRENASAFSLYIRKETKNGIIKLDDKIYLSPFK